MRDSHKDSKITGIDHLDVLTNGTVDEIRNTVTNPNQIGNVVNTKTNQQISQITPAFMIYNQGLSDLHSRIDALVENGADLNMEIDYYATPRTANQISEMRKV
jgi:hypothetical protein